MAKANDYTATATAEKRLREILKDRLEGYVDPETLFEIGQMLLAHATIELKPRLKAVQILIPIPQPKPEPKLGEFSPKPVPEDGYNDEEAPVE